LLGMSVTDESAVVDHGELEQVYCNQRLLSSLEKQSSIALPPPPHKERLFIPRMESRGLSSPTFCKRGIVTIQ
jgi:hypothetical protein